MSASMRWVLVALALGLGWTFFGDRVRPMIQAWSQPIEPTAYTPSRGDPDGLSAPAPAPAPATGRAGTPRREHIRDRVRRKVEADLERGARRSEP